MKKILLSIILAFAFVLVNAQCTPDPQFTAAGIYPDSIAGLPFAAVGQPYNEVITIICPLDTIVDFNGVPLSVNVETIELTSLTGLPPSFSYDCAVPSCIFSGGSISCAVLLSNGPTISEIGVHQIIINTETTVDAGIGFPIEQVDVIDYYYINVTNGTSVINQFNDFTFEVKDIFPNPVNNKAKIQFISGYSTDVVFSVFNYLGEKIEERNIAAYRGVNDIEISANYYANGVYLYSINNGIQVVSKRMIIEN